MSNKAELIDQPTPPRAEDNLDIDSLKSYLVQQSILCQPDDELQLLQFPGGASNLTYQININDRNYILRTAPKGANIKGAHDMQREYRVLSLLGDHFPYCPGVVHYCDNEEVIGRPFFIMDKITGLIPRKEMPVVLNATENQQLCKNLVQVQVALHEVDYHAAGLEQFGKPEGYVQRQIQGWNQRYQNARTDDVPDALELQSWLENNRTEDFHIPAIIHNDFKFDNVILDPDNPTSIISVLDWEMATIGDPLMDLGCSLAYWIEASDPDPMQQIRMLPTIAEGMMTRNEIISYYCQLRNIHLKDFSFYRVFGLFRLAVIVQQIYARFVAGKTHNPKFSNFGMICRILIQAAETAAH